MSGPTAEVTLTVFRPLSARLPIPKHLGDDSEFSFDIKVSVVDGAVASPVVLTATERQEALKLAHQRLQRHGLARSEAVSRHEALDDPRIRR